MQDSLQVYTGNKTRSLNKCYANLDHYDQFLAQNQLLHTQPQKDKLIMSTDESLRILKRAVVILSQRLKASEQAKSDVSAQLRTKDMQIN